MMPFIIFKLKGIHIGTLKFYSQASFNHLLRETIWMRLSLRDYKSPPSPPPPLPLTSMSPNAIATQL